MKRKRNSNKEEEIPNFHFKFLCKKRRKNKSTNGKESTLKLKFITSGSYGDVYKSLIFPNVVIKKSKLLCHYQEKIENIIYSYMGIHSINLREILFSNYLKKNYFSLINDHNLCLPYTIHIDKQYNICQYLPQLDMTLIEWRKQYLNKLPSLEFKFWILVFLFQLADTLNYLQPYFIHGDIYPKNIMISRFKAKGEIKTDRCFTSFLIDCGACRFSQMEEKKQKNKSVSSVSMKSFGCPEFVLPQSMFNSSSFPIKNDVFSLALCILYALEGNIEKKENFIYAKTYYDLHLEGSTTSSFIPMCLKEKNKNNLQFLQNDSDLLKFLLLMLQIDETKRICMKDVKNWVLNYFFKHNEFHLYFKKYFGLFFKNIEGEEEEEQQQHKQKQQQEEKIKFPSSSSSSSLRNITDSKNRIKNKIHLTLLSYYLKIKKQKRIEFRKQECSFFQQKAKQKNTTEIATTTSAARVGVSPQFYKIQNYHQYQQYLQFRKNRNQFISYILALNQKFSNLSLLVYSLLLFDLFYFDYIIYWNNNYLKCLSCSIFYISYLLYDNTKTISFFSLYQVLNGISTLSLTSSTPEPIFYYQISSSILFFILQILFFFSFDLLRLSLSFQDMDKDNEIWQQNDLYFLIIQ